MSIRITLPEIWADWTTERGSIIDDNDRDEVYFAVTGGVGSVSGHRPIEASRISPPPPEDYYKFWNQTRIHDIELANFAVDLGESALVTVVVREQDNAELPAIQKAAEAAAAAVAAYFSGDPQVAKLAAERAAEAAKMFYDALKQDRHQNIGSFAVRITDRDGQHEIDWIPGPQTELVWRDGSAALFKAAGSDAQYHFRTAVAVAQPSRPAVAAWSRDRLDIFALGNDRAMYHKAWGGNGWHPSQYGWEPLGGAFV